VLNLELMPAEFLIRNWRAGDRLLAGTYFDGKKGKGVAGRSACDGARKKLWPVATAEGCGLVWVRDFAAPALSAPPGAAQAIWIRRLVYEYMRWMRSGMPESEVRCKGENPRRNLLI